MCKISLAALGHTALEVDRHSEPMEKGAGFWYIQNGLPKLIKNYKGKIAKDQFLTLDNVSLSIMHSRLISAGQWCQANTQPFWDSEKQFMFCHNGTISMMDLIPVAVSLKIRAEEHWSDSRLLFEILRNVTKEYRSMILSHFSGNFVYVDHRNAVIHLYGNWTRVHNSTLIKAFYGRNKRHHQLDYQLNLIKGDALSNESDPVNKYWFLEETEKEVI